MGLTATELRWSWVNKARTLNGGVCHFFCVCLCVCGETPVMCFPICLSDCGWLCICGCTSGTCGLWTAFVLSEWILICVIVLVCVHAIGASKARLATGHDSQLLLGPKVVSLCHWVWIIQLIASLFETWPALLPDSVTVSCKESLSYLALKLQSTISHRNSVYSSCVTFKDISVPSDGVV